MGPVVTCPGAGAAVLAGFGFPVTACGAVLVVSVWVTAFSSAQRRTEAGSGAATWGAVYGPSAAASSGTSPSAGMIRIRFPTSAVCLWWQGHHALSLRDIVDSQFLVGTPLGLCSGADSVQGRSVKKKQAGKTGCDNAFCRARTAACRVDDGCCQKLEISLSERGVKRPDLPQKNKKMSFFMQPLQKCGIKKACKQKEPKLRKQSRTSKSPLMPTVSYG